MFAGGTATVRFRTWGDKVHFLEEAVYHWTCRKPFWTKAYLSFNMKTGKLYS